MWFTEYAAAGNKIGRITPLGVVTEFSAGITAGTSPYGDRGGPGWEPVVHRVDRKPDRADHDGGGSHRVLRRHHRRSESVGIAAGPDGNLWFTEYAGTGSGGSPRRER